jgi:hypothetical protein
MWRVVRLCHQRLSSIRRRLPVFSLDTVFRRPHLLRSAYLRAIYDVAVMWPSALILLT